MGQRVFPLSQPSRFFGGGGGVVSVLFCFLETSTLVAVISHCLALREEGKIRTTLAGGQVERSQEDCLVCA